MFLYIYIIKMGIKTYSVTLEEETVNKAKRKLKVGQKLSPVLNEILNKWIEGEFEEEND